jgi:nitrite reductase (NADH) small subunit
MAGSPTDGVVVMAADDLAEGERTTVEAFGTHIALFNLGGEIVAMDNACPHHGGPLCHGRVAGTWLPSEPQVFRWGMDKKVLSCPWHGWEFDLRDGTAISDANVRLSMYTARLENGHIVLYDRKPARNAAQVDSG